MVPRHILLIVLAFLAITEILASSSSSNKRCRRLPNLTNGQVTIIGKNNIDYKCNTGFKLAVTAKCSGRKLKNPVVTCEEILCEGNPVIVNGQLNSVIASRRIGVMYSFTCNMGFTGMGSVVCNECGEWEGGQTECTEILCEGNPVIVNGQLNSVIVSRRIGDIYSFTCNMGFTGMGSVVCNECGEWEGGQTECTEIPLTTTSPDTTTMNLDATTTV
ncbi:hypothetical protein LOTGIDRAFT_237505 [Lottia gigantea]|uniref:Sushi domain-containing protein n=1 Tax=Lottia gigantea TaxID=225164 RepID=V4BEA5_LOTGI|nr:hypothetical protein LOTGIDRAFT_237505 [Lottia gigantea]ESP04107.1 hypothetical protein LOTGIDRAFT_237505 [Lottia gigantea]